MAAAAPCTSRRSFRDSLKVLEADIQHANTLSVPAPSPERIPFLNFFSLGASDFSPDYDGAACPQMRISYSPAAHIFLFLPQRADCSLAGALGLLRIPI
uniref:Uncharacterized protein n=1 Tax=Aegilops tauschii TaxID=37682 RepID=M8C989_AEGTA